MGVGIGLLISLAWDFFHDINFAFNDNNLEYLYGTGLLTAGYAAVYAKDKIADYFYKKNAHKVRVPKKHHKIRFSKEEKL